MEKILVEAKSGSGKTTSLRNLDPEKTMVIQGYKKRLPFRHKGWKAWDKETQTGSIFYAPSFEIAQAAVIKMAEVGKEIIIIDDFVYMFANRVMDDAETKGFDKWNYLAKSYYNLLKTIDEVDSDARVYIFTHTDQDENGMIKMKTAGKLIDNLMTPEGQFTMVLGMRKSDDGAYFITNGGGTTPYKTPMDMFPDKEVPNDLKIIDDTICEFYGIGEED